jgi:tetratricopeptide (TPR) repeat protein
VTAPTIDKAALCRDAREALQRGDAQRCLALADLVLAHGDDPEALFLKAMALAETGRVGAALEFAGRAAGAAPEKAEYQAHHGRLLCLLRKDGEARRAADAAAERAADDDPLTLDTIGCVYSRLGDHAAALPFFERAVALEPRNVGYRFNLVSTYGFFARVDDAEIQYEQILKLQPDHGKAHLGLAGLRRQTPQSNHVARLEDIWAKAADPADRLRIQYAAAKEYEDLGDYDAAFRHLSEGNRDHAKRLSFDIETDERNASLIKEVFSDAGYLPGESEVPDAPIFVVGLPRTGTTLADRILSAHSLVSSAGELQSMPLTVKRLAQTKSRLVLDPETILKAGQAGAGEAGAAYIGHARQRAGAEGAIFIDKLPLNFLYIGYICKALPKAKIVCLRRHPMDSVWSNFKNLFATTSSYYAYSYDLISTARFYLLFDRLMAFWNGRYPGRVYELRYEDLVEDQEAQTRRLLDYCGLGWEAACLDFHNSAGAVATPSAMQVRQPVYNSSVGKWRLYERHLAPVRAFFEEHGVAV